MYMNNRDEIVKRELVEKHLEFELVGAVKK